MPNKNNIKWYIILFIALIFFLIGLNTGQYLYNIITIILAFIVYKFGYKSMFADFDQKQNEKRKQADIIYSALKKGNKKHTGGND